MPTVGPITRAPAIDRRCIVETSNDAPVRIATRAPRPHGLILATSPAPASTIAPDGQLGAAWPHATSALTSNRRIDGLAATRAYVSLHRLGEPDVQRIGEQRVADRRLDDL